MCEGTTECARDRGRGRQRARIYIYVRVCVCACVRACVLCEEHHNIILADGDSLANSGLNSKRAPYALLALTAIEHGVVMVLVDRVVKLPSYVVHAAFFIAVVPADEDCND